MGVLKTDRVRVLAFRARASHLDRKLRAGSLAEAAHGGLQDSAPRAAVISVHVRIEDVGPQAWEDTSLVQIWGPRSADYVVPRADVGVFTVGRLPRDPDRAGAIERLAAAVHSILRGRTLRTREVRVRDAICEEALAFPVAGGRAEVRWFGAT